MTVSRQVGWLCHLFLNFTIAICLPSGSCDTQPAISQCRVLHQQPQTSSMTRKNGSPLTMCNAMATLIGKPR
jgi:hypothetical protein